MKKVVLKSPALRVRVASIGLAGVAAIVSVLGYFYGGYYTSEWSLTALLLAAMICVAGLVGILGGNRSLWGVLATGAFLAFTSWTFLSILWSVNRGDAWLGSTLTLLYLLGFWVTATLVALGGSRKWAMSILCIGPGVTAALMLLTLSGRVEGSFEGGRLLGTVGYFNAEAAFLLVSLWTGIYVAGSRRVNPAVRALALASAVICIEAAVLTQSRGAMVSLFASLPVYFLFSGQRLRGLLALVPIVASLLITFPGLNQVYVTLIDGDSGLAALEAVQTQVWVTTGLAGMYGLLWGILERSWRPGELLVRIAGVAATISVAVLIIVGGIFLVERVGNPFSWVQEQWIVFKTNDTSGQDTSRYMSASGSGRYVLWEVAWNDFASNPVLGIGTHNFEATYYRDRQSNVGWIEQPHSLPLEIVSERGIIGGILFSIFLGTCVLSGLWKRFGVLNSEGKAQVGALLACVTYWFVHSSAEWFWQIPAITLPAMIYLAMLVTPWQRPQEREEVYAPSARPLRLAGIGVALLTLVVVGPLLVASYFQDRADEEENPWVALNYVERARLFNPLDSDLARQEGDLAYRIGDIPLATRSYSQAIDLDPQNYAPYALLGVAYEGLGRQEQALQLYEKSVELNPLDDSLKENVARMEQQLASAE